MKLKIKNKIKNVRKKEKKTCVKRRVTTQNNLICSWQCKDNKDDSKQYNMTEYLERDWEVAG